MKNILVLILASVSVQVSYAGGVGVTPERSVVEILRRGVRASSVVGPKNWNGLLVTPQMQVLSNEDIIKAGDSVFRVRADENREALVELGIVISASKLDLKTLKMRSAFDVFKTDEKLLTDILAQYQEDQVSGETENLSETIKKNPAQFERWQKLRLPTGQ